MQVCICILDRHVTERPGHDPHTGRSELLSMRSARVPFPNLSMKQLLCKVRFICRISLVWIWSGNLKKFFSAHAHISGFFLKIWQSQFYASFSKCLPIHEVRDFYQFFPFFRKNSLENRNVNSFIGTCCFPSRKFSLTISFLEWRRKNASKQSPLKMLSFWRCISSSSSVKLNDMSGVRILNFRNWICEIGNSFHVGAKRH